MTAARTPDYVAIGHITIDRTPAGDMLGGTVLYAALTAARYGLRTGILTRANISGMASPLREQLQQLSGEVEIVAQDADGTTTFTNRDVAGRRAQTLHDWGGPIDLNGLPPLWRSAAAIHVAPVAQEIDPRQLSRLSPRFLGCTPQGWMRQWDGERFGAVRATPLRLPADLVSRFDALVISSEEYTSARDLVESIGKTGLIAVTRGQQGAAITDRGRQIAVPAVRVTALDDTGAGDVFAGALFAARSERESVAASARYATAAAALKVQGHGVQAIPHREDVEALIEARGLRESTGY